MRRLAFRRPASVPLLFVLAAVMSAAGAPVAQAGWQKPVALTQQPLNAAGFLVTCDADSCAPADWVVGRFRMTGPRTGVGAVTLPELCVWDTETGEQVTDGRVPDPTDEESRLRYGVCVRLFGVALRDGAWTLTDLHAYANARAPWGELDFDLGVDAAGDALLVHHRSVSTGAQREAWTVAREYRGGAWGEPVRLDAPSVGLRDDGDQPELAIAANGDALLYYEDWACPNGESYCQTVPNWMRRRVGGVWQPAQLVNQDSRSPGASAAALGGDGTGTVVWSPFQGGKTESGVREIAVRTVGADGKLGPVARTPALRAWHPQAVGGPGGRALIVGDYLNDGTDQHTSIAATAFDGTSFGPATVLAAGRGPWDDFMWLEGTADDARLLYVDGGWALGTGMWDKDLLVLNPMQRRLMLRRWSGGAWTDPVPVDGGLPAPAQQSVLGPDDVAAGGGAVIFAAGAPTVDGLRGADRVYAVDVSGGVPSAPVAIDNGPGGWVHAVAVDRWTDGGSAALFTQLGPDGNVRLYGVERTGAGAVSRRPVFGRELCTDPTSQLAGCTTAALEPVRAEVAPPRVDGDGALVVRGRAVEVVGRPAGAKAAGLASAAVRTRALKRGTVLVAVQQRTAKGACRWWVRARRRFVAGSCREPVFSVAKVRAGRFALSVGRLPAGRVTVWTRATNGKAKQQVLKLGTSRRTVTVRARR